MFNWVSETNHHFLCPRCCAAPSEQQCPAICDTSVPPDASRQRSPCSNVVFPYICEHKPIIFELINNTIDNFHRQRKKQLRDRTPILQPRLERHPIHICAQPIMYCLKIWVQYLSLVHWNDSGAMHNKPPSRMCPWKIHTLLLDPI